MSHMEMRQRLKSQSHITHEGVMSHMEMRQGVMTHMKEPKSQVGVMLHMKELHMKKSSRTRRSHPTHASVSTSHTTRANVSASHFAHEGVMLHVNSSQSRVAYVGVILHMWLCHGVMSRLWRQTCRTCKYSRTYTYSRTYESPWRSHIERLNISRTPPLIYKRAKTNTYPDWAPPPAPPPP